MRIYSKFHDYYDVVQAKQYDETGEVWIRNSFQAEKDDVKKVMSLLKAEPDNFSSHFKPKDALILKNGYYVSYKQGINHSCLACLVGVAGKIYPMIETQFRYFRGKEWQTYTDHWFDFKSFSTCHEIMFEKRHFYDGLTYPQWFFNLKREALTSEPWALLKTPVFIIRPLAGEWRSKEYSIEGNPELRLMNFMKVLDPYSCWQEIDTFLNNQLVNELDPGNVPEKERWIQHGFDATWSFRTRPFS